MAEPEPITCTYCGDSGTQETMAERVIVYRVRRNGRVIVAKEQYWFCKDRPCGGNYQMGCEG